jgi:hypothetical protein
MTRKIMGILIIILGVVGIFVSMYIKGQIGIGRSAISSAEEKVSMGKTLFSLSPATKEIGKGITRGAEEKIEAGRQEISKYDTLANWALIGGIVVIVLGATILFIPGKKSKK